MFSSLLKKSRFQAVSTGKQMKTTSSDGHDFDAKTRFRTSIFALKRKNPRWRLKIKILHILLFYGTLDLLLVSLILN
jgi:hypothetical protein